MKRKLSLFLTVSFFLLLLPSISADNASIPICGPHPNLGPTEYCSFGPLIKVGEDDAIIDLSWDAMSPGIQGLPTPDMVGDYYFYFKDGRLYYLGNTTGAYELLYVFHNGLWYLSDGKVIYPEKPCIVENVTIPKEIRPELCPCSNVSLKSKSYPAVLNGSTVEIIGVDFTPLIELPHMGNSTYVLRLPENLSLHLPPNVTLRAVFLGRGVLIYTYPMRFDTPLSWSELRVLYYDGRTLKVLNFTRAFKKGLPVCESLPEKRGDRITYELVLGTASLGLTVWKIREIRRR